MGSEFNLISQDAQRALEVFAQDAAMAFTQASVAQWAKELGLSNTSSALKTTYPIPVDAAGYHEFKGDIKYRSLFAKSISLTPKTWQDGVAELASVIEAPDFTGWARQPEAMAAAGMSLPNDIIAGLLEANAVQTFDGKAFFASDHPNNIMDDSQETFDNDITGAGTDPTIANLEIAMANFDAMKAPNGKPAGLRMTHVLHPPSQRGIWRRLLEQDNLIQALSATQFGSVQNIYKGEIVPVVSYELTDDDKWYPMALNKPGMYPWIVQDQGEPEQIISDKSSFLYQSTLKVGIAYILRGNGALMLPQTMQRWAGTAP